MGERESNHCGTMWWYFNTLSWGNVSRADQCGAFNNLKMDKKDDYCSKGQFEKSVSNMWVGNLFGLV